MTGSRADPSAEERRALRSVALQFWVNGAVFSSFLPRLPELRHQIGVDLAGLGLLLTAGSLGGLVGSTVGGPAIGRFGSKRTMTVSALGLVATLPVVGLAGGPLPFLAALMVMQLFDAVTDMSMNLQGSWLSARRPVPVMSRLHGLWSVGTLMGGAATSVAASLVSLRVHLLVVAGVLLATIAYVTPGLLARDEAGPGAGGEGLAWSRLGRRGLGFVLLAVAMVGIEGVPTDWSSLRLSDDFGLPASTAGLGFVAMSAGMVASRLGGDWATARLGPVRLAHRAAGLAAAGLGLATLAPTPGPAVAGFCLTGLGAGVMFPRLYDQAAQAPGPPGVMLGALTAGIRIGILTLPVAVGTLADTRLPVGAAMALVALPGALVLLLVRERLDPDRAR